MPNKLSVTGWAAGGAIALVLGAAGDCYRNPDMGIWKLSAAVAAIGCFAQSYSESFEAEDSELQQLAALESDRQLEAEDQRLHSLEQLKMREMEAEERLKAHQVIAEGRAEEYFYKTTGITPQRQVVDVPAQTQAVLPAPQAPTQEETIAQPVASNVVTSPQWAAKPAQLATPAVIGCPILDEIVTSKRSTVAAAPSGTGKSVSRAYVLSQFNQRYPDGEIYVISQKNDSFQGLREAGRLEVFDIMSPQTAFEQLKVVFEVFNERRHALEGDRAQFDSKPVRLLIDDWHSIYDSIKGTDFYKKELKQLLSTIVTVGREMNVSLMIDTQSFNLASLGLAEDANIRLSLNITCQGYTFTDEYGQTQGDYAMISNLLNNRYLVPEGGDLLKAEYEQLKGRSQAQKTPVVFTSVGRPRLGLLPDLRAYKPGLIAPVAVQSIASSPASADIYDMVNAVKVGAV